jgi:hypothetical protein
MELLFIDKSNKKLMYEEINCYDLIEEKFGKREVNEENKEEFKTLEDVTIVCKNGGIAFHTEDEAWFLGFDSELRKVTPLIRINFQINKGQMTLNKISRCPDPGLILLDFVKDYTSHLILVWNVNENKEKFNFSTNNDFQFINGPGSKAGFILNAETYVNLDTGLINYFFEYEFTSTAFYEQVNGYRINRKQDLILEYGNVITKETLIEVLSLDEYILCETSITEVNINLERIRFQVDGNTSLHYFALEYETLKLILDYMEQHRQEYLTGILMKNNKGKSPLDITLDNESPKNTELLLRKLAIFRDKSLSGLFYDRFNELFAMDILAFHEYLDS